MKPTTILASEAGILPGEDCSDAWRELFSGDRTGFRLVIDQHGVYPTSFELPKCSVTIEGACGGQTGRGSKPGTVLKPLEGKDYVFKQVHPGNAPVGVTIRGLNFAANADEESDAIDFGCGQLPAVENCTFAGFNRAVAIYPISRIINLAIRRNFFSKNRVAIQYTADPGANHSGLSIEGNQCEGGDIFAWLTIPPYTTTFRDNTAHAFRLAGTIIDGGDASFTGEYYESTHRTENGRRVKPPGLVLRNFEGQSVAVCCNWSAIDVTAAPPPLLMSSRDRYIHTGKNQNGQLAWTPDQRPDGFPL